MTTLYGIRQCDTCRKAIQWLDQRGVEYRFHDLRTDGLDAGMIEDWLTHLPLSTLINRRSTTWRSLDKAAQERLSDGDWRELAPGPSHSDQTSAATACRDNRRRPE